MNELGLFTGAGGFALAGKLLGWRSVGYVEWDERACDGVLRPRIDEGVYDAAPVWRCDVRDFVRHGYADLYQDMVDVVTAGFPCQPFSCAGNMLGADDPRNMWPATIAVIRRVRPRWVFLENVAKIRNPKREKGKVLAPSYLGRIFVDLAESGFDIAWDCIRARDLGAPHERDRIWIVAHTNRGGCNAGCEPTGRAAGSDAHRCRSGTDVGDTKGVGLDARTVETSQSIAQYAAAMRAGWWAAEPGMGRVAHGVADQTHQLRWLGQGIVPAVAACAWRVLCVKMKESE